MERKSKTFEEAIERLTSLTAEEWEERRKKAEETDDNELNRISEDAAKKARERNKIKDEQA